MYWLETAQSLTRLHIPQRFRGYDDRSALVRVTDLDRDGNLELWWSENFVHCDNDYRDFERDINCRASSADMGEIREDVLTHFVLSKPPFDIVKAELAAAPKRKLKVVEARSSYDERDEKICNQTLIASILSKKLPIEFGTKDDGGKEVESDVVDLQCTAHPSKDNLKIVALFYQLKDKKKNRIEDQTGFALATLDIEKSRVKNFYREIIEQDASVRIYSGTLHLFDKAYQIAPDTHAIPVRMDISYSPRCAEGSSGDYLSLFIEEGKTFRPVLKNRAMEGWELLSGPPCGSGNEETVSERTVYTLKVLEQKTNGWHDLELTAHTKTETYNAEKESNSISKERVSSRILSAKDKKYDR